MITQQEDNTTLSTSKGFERAVLYARVSGDDRGNDGRNLVDQLEMGREYAEKKGYNIIAELAEDDRGASGYKIDLPQLTKIREMAQRNEFDVLIVREIDRLSRNLAKQLIIEEELSRAGVRIEYVLSDYADTPEGRLNKHIRATIAEYEREKIKERLIRGRRNKVKAGSIIARLAPYGYKKEKVEDKTMLVIDENTEKFVKLIFELYTKDGLSLRKVAKYLNEIGAPLPDSVIKNRTGWGASTVRGILKNEAYIGKWHYGKSNPYRSNKRKDRINDESNWLTVYVPAIIGEQVFRLAQDRLIQNKQNARRNRKHKYLLSGRVTCGSCGYKCRGHAVKSGNRKNTLMYYVCPGRRKDDGYLRQCDLPYFRVDVVDALVWNWIKELLNDDESFRIGWENYQSEEGKRIAPLRERLEVVESLIKENEDKFNRLLELYLKGDFPKETLETHKSQLTITLNSLKREQESLQTQLENQTLSEEQIKTIQEFIATVRPEIEDADFETKQRIITMLNVEATLTIEEGKKFVYARCVVSQDTAFDCDEYNVFYTTRGSAYCTFTAKLSVDALM